MVAGCVLGVAHALRARHALRSDLPGETARVTWLRGAGPASTTALVAPDYVGNYLEARYGARGAHVFIDDRVDMYPQALVEDSLVLLRGQPGWSQILDELRAGVVLWPRTTRR